MADEILLLFSKPLIVRLLIEEGRMIYQVIKCAVIVRYFKKGVKPAPVWCQREIEMSYFQGFRNVILGQFGLAG
jgi:hypothetical protein